MDRAEGTGEAYREWVEARARKSTLKEVRQVKSGPDDIDEWLNDEIIYADRHCKKARQDLTDITVDRT